MPLSPTFAAVRLRNFPSFAPVRTDRAPGPALAAGGADVR